VIGDGKSIEPLEMRCHAMKITLNPALEGKITVAWGTVDEICHQQDPGFAPCSLSVQEELQSRYGGLKPSEIPLSAPARRLYRTVGMEPTRYRPSSEALLRRVLKGNGLYSLDPVVDTGNLFSLETGLPLGLYDLSHINGSVEIRLGLDGESYQGIGKGIINVGGRLCLADEQGPFGSPTSDSDRCRIRENTSAILYLLYAPGDHDRDELSRESVNLATAFARWNGGNLTAQGEIG
jgi:DNA/RNA-binding domain of Phe-tRNA-synthetase-like protein